MRNVLKAATLESKFPLLAVKKRLPELFTVTGSEYEAMDKGNQSVAQLHYRA